MRQYYTRAGTSYTDAASQQLQQESDTTEELLRISSFASRVHGYVQITASGCSESAQRRYSTDRKVHVLGQKCTC